MRRVLVRVALGLSLLAAAEAQDLSTQLAAADQRIKAREWKAALEGLLGLQEVVASDAEREQLANKLSAVGEGLRGESTFDSALRAHEAALAMRKRLYGDHDHADLALSLSKVARCLRSVGEVDRALLHFEQALAMRKRLLGDRDDPDVAAGLNNVATCLAILGQTDKALLKFEDALAMGKRLHGDRDDANVAWILHNIAFCLKSLDQADKAVPQYEAALAMRKRIYGDRDHPDVAATLHNIADCFQSLGQADKALQQYEAAHAMRKRIYGDRDHPDVAASLHNMAYCLRTLGLAEKALPQFEAGLAMRRRLYGDRDHREVAMSLDGVADCLSCLGQADQALPQFEAGLAMHRRLYGDRDHPDVAFSLNYVAACLLSLGLADKALPQFEAALAMRKRIYGDRDHSHVATNLNSLAGCLQSLGQADKALPQYEASLAMHERLYGDRDHPNVAASLDSVAHCLSRLGQTDKALPQFEAALVMRKRIYGDRDHPDVAGSLNNVAFCLQSLGQADKALPQYEAALAMKKRVYGDRDHPDVALGQNNLASCLFSLGQAEKALKASEAAMAMFRSVYGDRDHWLGANNLTRVAACLQTLGQADKALPQCESACAMIERLRERSQTSSGLRQALFDELKRGGAFERLQSIAVAARRPDVAMHAAERGRGRELLDMLEQHRFDPLEEGVRRARLRGDEAAAARMRSLHDDLDSATLDSDRLLHQLTRLAEQKLGDGEREARRKELIAESDRVSLRHRQLLDERARLLADVVPAGQVRTAAEIATALQGGELFLEFTVADDHGLLYVVARDTEVSALPLPAAAATVKKSLQPLLRWISREQLSGSRDPGAGSQAGAETAAASNELFESLIPKELWPRIQSARRVFVAAHRSLHRLPFELLVTEVKDGKPVYWLDNGPEIAYVQSGSALCWLRQPSKQAADDTTSLDLLAVGDPRMRNAKPEVPEQGTLVLAVDKGGEGARVGLQPRDAIVRYDGKELVDDTTLRDMRTQTEAAMEDGKRPKALIPIEVWRHGEMLKFEVNPGLLGIQVGTGRARSAHEAALGGEAQLERITRSGDLERISRLPPLRGARAETDAIADIFTSRGRKAQRLLEQHATEPAVFDLAAKARYLHFACHGIAEEYAGQSLSMLVLSLPRHVLPADDGLLKLDDLLHRWRGRLASCRLVVLSACRTNVGRLYRDEAPQALPIGFLCAGASAVISSLWSVDDASTRELMTEFYGRLIAGEKDRLAAFTAAKKALRQKFPDPFYWAPFLYVGSPE